MGGDEFAQAARTSFFRHFQNDLHIEAKLATAFGQHRFKRCDIQRVLALIVGGTAAIPAAIFFV